MMRLRLRRRFPPLRGFGASLLVALQLLLPIAARANHFGVRPDGTGTAGIVTSHGVDLFVIETSSGSYLPRQRAAVVAARLEALYASRQLDPRFLTVGTRNGEVVLRQTDPSGEMAGILLTVDRDLANRVPGANGSAERLAEWWLSVLRDHASLMLGREPVATGATPTGDAFEKVYRLLGPPSGPVGDEEIRAAIERLPANLKEALAEAAHRVPPGFHPAGTVLPTGSDAAGSVPAADSDGKSRSSGGGEVNPPLARPEPQTGAGDHPNSDRDPSALAHAIHVEITTDPPTVTAGQRTAVSLKLTRSPADTPEPVPGTAVVLRIRSEDAKEDAPWVIARTTETAPGVYTFHAIFQGETRYQLSATVIPAGSDPFAINFILTVKAAAGSG